MLPPISQLLCNNDRSSTDPHTSKRPAVRPQAQDPLSFWTREDVHDPQLIFRDNHHAPFRASGLQRSPENASEMRAFVNTTLEGSTVPCSQGPYREHSACSSNFDELLSRMHKLHDSRPAASECSCRCGKISEEKRGENLWRQGQLLGGSQFPSTHDLPSFNSDLFLDVPANPRMQHKQLSMLSSGFGPATPDGLFFQSFGRMSALRPHASHSIARDCFCSSCKSRQLNESKMDDWIAASVEAARYHHHHVADHHHVSDLHRYVAETYNSPRGHRHTDACSLNSENLRPLNVSLFSESPSYRTSANPNICHKRRRIECDFVSAVGSNKFPFQRPSPRTKSSSDAHSSSSSSRSSASVLVDLDALEPAGTGRYAAQEESEGSSDRKAKVAKYRERRQARRIRIERKGYETRRELASMRTRIKGRFVKESSETWKCSSVESSS